MPPESVDLLDALKGEAHYSSAVFGTYQFDGQFFEENIHPTTRALDVANTVVLTDSQEYEAATDLRHAGERYYFDHVRCPGIHHPKFSLLLGHERGLAIIGSANLTESGWRRNAEIVTLIRYEEGESTQQEKLVFAELKAFLEELIAREMVPSRKTQDAIEAGLDDAPWIPDTEISAGGSALQLLHNLNEPILPRVLKAVNDHSLTKAEIFSPFFSGDDISVLEALVEAGVEDVVLNIQPDSVEGFQSSALTQDTLTGANVTVQSASMADDDSRYLHAKLILLTGPERVWTLYGSTNATTPALLKTTDSGNVELSVLRTEPDPTYFADFIGSDVVETAEIEASDVEHRRRSHSTIEREIDFRVSEAYLDGDGALVIEFDELNADEGTLHLRRGKNDDECDISVTGLRDGELRISEERVTTFCREATFLFLSVEPDGEQLESNRRWVSLPSLVSVPRPSERTAIENSKGRHGLIEVLNRLEGWESLLHFLDAIDFAVSGSEQGGVSISPFSQDDEEGGPGMEPRQVTDLSDVFEEKVASFHDQVQEKSSAPEGSETWEERFHNLVDFYIGGSKFTLWWVSQDRDEIRKLRFIRTSTQELLRFVRLMRRMADDQDARNFEEDHRLLEHVAIIAYLSDRLQTSAGFHRGANERVYQIFCETWREALETLGDACEGAVPHEDNIENCIDEYTGLQIRLPNPRRIRNFARELIEET